MKETHYHAHALNPWTPTPFSHDGVAMASSFWADCITTTSSSYSDQHEKHTKLKRYKEWNVNREGNFEWETHMHWAP